MTNATSTPATTRIRDATVRERTGKGWDEWFTILDGIGTAEMTQKGIVDYLGAHYEVRRWWRMTLARTYLIEHGQRQKHHRPDGYAIVRTTTITVPVTDLWKAWTDEATRRKWLADPAFTIRRATENKSLRITWVDGKTHVDAMFGSRKNQRSQIIVQHRKLTEPADVKHWKAYWGENLTRLKTLLET